MSYTPHNFTDGQVLTHTALNEMDTQLSTALQPDSWTQVLDYTATADSTEATQLSFSAEVRKVKVMIVNPDNSTSTSSVYCTVNLVKTAGGLVKLAYEQLSVAAATLFFSKTEIDEQFGGVLTDSKFAATALSNGWLTSIRSVFAQASSLSTLSFNGIRIVPNSGGYSVKTGTTIKVWGC